MHVIDARHVGKPYARGRTTRYLGVLTRPEETPERGGGCRGRRDWRTGWLWSATASYYLSSQLCFRPPLPLPLLDACHAGIPAGICSAGQQGHSGPWPEHHRQQVHRRSRALPQPRSATFVATSRVHPILILLQAASPMSISSEPPSRYTTLHIMFSSASPSQTRPCSQKLRRKST